MKNKRFILIAIALLLSFCFPQHVVSGKGKKLGNFFEAWKNPIPSAIYNRGIHSPYGNTVTTAQLNALRNRLRVETAQLNALCNRLRVETTQLEALLGPSNITSIKTAQPNALHERSIIAPATKRDYRLKEVIAYEGLSTLNLVKQQPVKIIDEQQVKQKIEQMQEQLFDKGMKFDFEFELTDGEVGFIIYTYGYKIDAA